MNAPPAALLDARYRVDTVIARGGMSTVYRGVDTRLDRPVAIKIMDAQLAGDPTFRMRFEREARSAARIDHPAVVDVHDQGEVAGPDGPVAFLVMELVEGGTLRDVLRARGALGVPAAVAVLRPVLAGLAAAHRLGLVHRDVKPENVLISGHGEVKVADFGLVTAAAQAGTSHAGLIMGTVAYLSPEQVETGAADARSDVYAAGILLYELLVGQPPYTGDTAISVAYRHVNCDVPAPSATAGDVPLELDELVVRATRRNPADRPADAGALLIELGRVAEQLDIPTVAAPVPAAAEPLAMAAAAGPNGAGPVGVGPGGTRALPRPVEPSSPFHDGQPAPHPEPAPHRLARRRSQRIFAGWMAVIALLAVLVGTTAWWLGSGRWTQMPAVVGLSETNAQQVLAQADLVATTTRGGDGRTPTGVVTASDQATGTRLLRGSTVSLTVSSGRPTVPAIPAGTSTDEAEGLLRAAGLDPDVDRDDAEYSNSVPEDMVIRTKPAAGTEVARGDTVRLVLSRGPDQDEEQDDQNEQVEVPFLINKRFDDAREELERRGLDVQRNSQFGIGRRNGIVIQQSHGQGSRVDRGTTITLTTL